jgi:hypothetical protein
MDNIIPFKPKAKISGSDTTQARDNRDNPGASKFASYRNAHSSVEPVWRKMVRNGFNVMSPMPRNKDDLVRGMTILYSCVKQLENEFGSKTLFDSGGVRVLFSPNQLEPQWVQDDAGENELLIPDTISETSAKPLYELMRTEVVRMVSEAREMAHVNKVANSLRAQLFTT